MPLENHMNGIRSYIRNWEGIDAGFAYLYRPLYPMLRDLFFTEAIADSCFSFPYDDESYYDAFAASKIESNLGDGLFKSDVLFDLDRFVTDDWNSITLVDVDDLRRNRTIANHLHKECATKAAAEDRRIVMFHNYDGAFWQFFTNVSEISTAMLEAQGTNSNLDLRLVKYDADYPCPGVFRDDYPPTA